jgi:hypothetical protein
MHDFPQFVDWAFKGIVAGTLFYGVGLFAGMKHSIDELNIRMAQVIERMTHHQKEIDKHDERLSKIEERI